MGDRIGFFLATLALCGMAACSVETTSEDDGASFDSGSGSGTGNGATVGTGATTAGATTGAGAGEPNGNGQGGASAGTLTAGDWDDNLNWDIFDAYRTDMVSGLSVGEVAVEDRVTIRVETDQGAPISSAVIDIHDQSSSFLTAPVGSDGRILFFPGHDGAANATGLEVTVTPPGGSAFTVAAPAGPNWTITVPGVQAALPQALDLAFVLDATGSMNDEIAYLQAEIEGIADDVAAAFPNVATRFGLVVYRDDGDAYVTRSFPFDTLSGFKATLDQQNASGGGDFPEAMDAGLADALALDWRSGNTVRMAFLVADAPPHSVDGQQTLDHADQMRRDGIRLYTIAASGVDPVAEYYLRHSSQLTLARYLFLTDDSGVGNPHTEPHIPCYQVQLLKDQMNRMIASELTGERIPADPEKVIRAVGNPDEFGVCQLPDGQTAQF